MQGPRSHHARNAPLPALQQRSSPRRQWRPPAAARPVASNATFQADQKAAQGLPHLHDPAPLLTRTLPADLPQDQALRQAPTAAATAGGAPTSAAVAARQRTEPVAASSNVWAARLGQLAEAVQQTAVRLRRQVELPPPGFPPGPPGDAAVQMLQQPLAFLEGARRQHGGVVGLLLGGERVVLVSEPAAARAVLEGLPGRAPPFVKQGTAFFPGSSLTGSGLLTSDGEVWRRQRRLVNPAFRRAAVDKYAEAMLGATQRMLRVRWRDGWVRDVYADFNQLTLEITLEALFGGGRGSQALAGAEITDAIQQAFAFFARRGAAAMAIPEWVPTPDNLGFNAAVARLDRAVYDLIAERRRELASMAEELQQQQRAAQEPSQGPVPRDLLDSLLLASGEGGERMEDGAARDELMTLLIAGQETSAILLGWACAYLAHHPELQAAAAAEVRALLHTAAGTSRSSSSGSGSGSKGGTDGGTEEESAQGSTEGDGRTLEAADSRRLPLVEAIVLEAMRLSPPAYLVGRCAAEDTQLGGYRLAKGTTVLLSPYLLHRDADAWGPDAATFRPGRWLELTRQAQQAQQGPASEPSLQSSSADGCPHSGGGSSSSSSASSSSSSSRSAAGSGSGGGSGGGGGSASGGGTNFLTGLGPNGAYIPFGAGQRNCVGSGFAMTEAVLVLAAVLDRFTLQPLPGAAFPQAQPQITLRPANVRLLLRRRWE